MKSKLINTVREDFQKRVISYVCYVTLALFCIVLTFFFGGGERFLNNKSIDFTFCSASYWKVSLQLDAIFKGTIISRHNKIIKPSGQQAHFLGIRPGQTLKISMTLITKLSLCY